MRRLAAGLLALFAISAVSGATRPAIAQEEPPARVGRVSFVAGQLGFHAAGETQWSAAAVNYPVAAGGAFWTDPQSRAEFRIGGQTIALSGDTEIDLTRLDQQVIQIALPQGRIALHLRQLAEGNSVEIDLPRGGVWLLQPGRYDIDAGTPDRPARIMVFEGSARFVGGTLDQGIKAGEAAVIGGTDTLTATIERATPDAFVEWCRSRDYPEKRLAAPYYVSPEMTGFEDLDAHGSWGEVPDYGEVWYPSSVAADWAPYRDGHWVSVEPWGWTWVDAAPWGFAPSHYGRWARIQDRWGWLPGRFVPQPVYAPALVAFIGDSGRGFGGAGARGPAVGWFPLGPDEVYWPNYSRNPTYIRNINITNVSQTQITNITNITNVIVNRPAAGPPPQVANQNFANRAAATVVPLRAFTSAAKVAPAALHVTPQALQQARISVPPAQVAPPSGHPAPAAPSTAAAIHPPGAPGTAPPIAGRGVHPPGAPGTAPPTAGPGVHPQGVPSAAPPVAGPGIHPPGVPGTAPPTAGPGVHPPGAPGTAPPIAGPAPPAGKHPAPAAVHLPPPTAAPQPAPHPVAVAPPPVVHAPPPPPHAAPPAAAPQPAPHPVAVAPPPAPHAAPPAAAPQPALHPVAVAPPPVVHAPPPAPHAAPPAAPPQPAPHPVAVAPPPVVHAPPPVVHAPPPAPHAAPPAAAPQPAPAAAAHPGGGPPPHGAPPRKAEPKKDEPK